MPRLLITCPRGLAPYLKQELDSLSVLVSEETPAGIWIDGDMTLAMRLNLQLRTANRVLVLLDTFKVSDPEDLYKIVMSMPWEKRIPADGYLSVIANADTPSIRDTRFLGLKVKDAVVDRIRDKKGRRPDSGPELKGTVLNVYWADQECSIYLDTTGETLSKRGYRRLTHTAPMQEGLAAGVVMATGWHENIDTAFINPMCGSGTIAIEAALMALGRAPGATRLRFAFESLIGFDDAAWKKMRSEARVEARKSIPGRIIATDIDPKAVDIARRNAETAGVEQHIEFNVCDYKDTEVPDVSDKGGVVVMNPEYGRRLGEERELEGLYSGMGDFLKSRCKGYKGYIFTGNMALAKKVGLRTSSRREFYNGPIECRLLEYELYEGSRRDA